MEQGIYWAGTEFLLFLFPGARGSRAIARLAELKSDQRADIRESDNAFQISFDRGISGDYPRFRQRGFILLPESVDQPK